MKQPPVIATNLSKNTIENFGVGEKRQMGHIWGAGFGMAGKVIGKKLQDLVKEDKERYTKAMEAYKQNQNEGGGRS
jgi:hypothetical protein